MLSAEQRKLSGSFSLFARRVLMVTTTRRAIPTKEMYQEGGAPSAIISERTAVKKKAPRMVPRMVPLPPVSRVPPTTAAAIDCSSIPSPSETLVEGSLARVTIADNPAKSEQRQNAEVFIRLTGTPRDSALAGSPPKASKWFP